MAQQNSQVLGKALGTTFPTPNQLGAYPGGSVPPVAAPAAAPAPVSEQPQGTDAELSKVTSAMGSQDVGALRTAQGQAMQQAGELTGLAAMLKSENEIKDATRNAERTKKDAEEVKTLESQREAKTGEYKAFVPTQESVKDLGMLFGLVSVAAFSSGGQGRYSGMAAMKNMSAAMQGYREGRNDIFNKELKEYDKNMAALKANNDLAQKTFDNAMKLMSVDKDAGMAEMKRLAAIDNNGMVAMQVRSGRFDEVGKILGHTADALEKEKLQRDKLAETAQTHAETIKHNRETEAHLSRMEIIARNRASDATTRRDEKAMQSIGPALRNIAEQYPDGTAETLVGASPEDKKRVQGSFRAVQESESVADFVAKNKGAVGALAVVKNILKIDAINSIKNEDENVAAQQKSQLVDNEIDKAASSGKISAQDAQDAKILQKKLFGLALADVQGSGQRGSVYLDRQFQNLYDQASRQDTLLKIIKERAKENNSNLKIYKLNIERNNDHEQFPLLEARSVEDYIKERAPSKTPTDAHVKLLKNNPSAENRKHFDEAYGEGTSRKVLGN
jgi:hypothetical protein